MPTRGDRLPAEYRLSLYSVGREEKRFQVMQLFAIYKPLTWLLSSGPAFWDCIHRSLTTPGQEHLFLKTFKRLA